MRLRVPIDTIFVPRGAEERAVRGALQRARAAIRVVATGVGPHAAARAADAALAGGRIERALVTGLCGLLSPAFAIGDALVYGSVDRIGSASRELDAALAMALAERIPDAQTGIRAIERPQIVTSAAVKAELGRSTAADAVDMESYALTERLDDAGTLVAVVRVASDGVAQDLPDLDRALDGSGGIDGGALALALVRRPIAGVRLIAGATRALRRLASVTYALAS